MSRRRFPLAALAFVTTLVVGLVVVRTPQAAEEDTAGLDYEFYKARIAPIVHRICGECHANPRKRLGKHFLRPAPGRRIRERHHKANFETIAGLLEAGNPAASLWLLKPIGPDQGGVTHEGGIQIRQNSAEYGAMVDFINGAKQPPPTFVIPETESGQPDFRFFVHKIEPVLQRVCSECHEGRGKGKFKLISHAGDEFPLQDHYANYQTVLKLLRPGDPERSRFLQKPLAVADGGFKHRGGDRIRKDDANYANWVAFIGGEVGAPLPSERSDEPTALTTEGLTVQAEDLEIDGDVRILEDPEAQGFHRVVAGKKGGTLTFLLRVREGADYRVGVRARTDGGALRLRVGPQPPSTLDVPAAEPEGTPTFVTVGPKHLVEGTRPLIDPHGDISLGVEGLELDGRRDGAAFLVAPGVRHRGVAARLWLPEEEDEADDVLVLFAMDDRQNGKFAGLTDGGRRFVMGLLEGGRRRVLQAVKAPVARHEGARTIWVDTVGGVAIGHLDGRPLAFLNLGNRLGEGPFGVATHGRAGVAHLAAMDEYEVYACQFGIAPVVHLPAGVVRLQIELPPGAASVDALEIRPATGP